MLWEDTTLLVKKILKNDIKNVIELVSKYNQILYDWIIPKIVDFAYELEKTTKTEDKEVILLKEPEEEYYTFKAKPELVISNKDNKSEIIMKDQKKISIGTYLCISNIVFLILQNFILGVNIWRGF